MAVNNSLTQKPKMSLTAYLTHDAVKEQINKVIGGKDGDKFISSIVSAVQTNPTLQECTNQSILSGALLGQSLNLSPSPQLGQYYLVPYNNKGVKEAQFQLGYKGMVQLAIRSGQYKRLNALAIKEGELIKYDPLNEEIEVKLIDDELARERAKTIGYYAMYELINGFKKSMYWSRQKMEAHAMRYSKGYQAKKGYTFWEKDFDGMALKTMYRRLLSTAPMSIEMQTAYEKDMAVIRSDNTVEYVDNADYEPTAVNDSNPSDSASGEEIIVEAVKAEEIPAEEPKKTDSVDKQASLFN